MPADMRARLGPLELPNPVLAAAGCAGAGRELAQFIDVARVGAIVDEPQLAPDGRQAPIGIIVAQDDSVFGARRKHAIGFVYASGDQIVDQDADVGLGPA